MEERDYTCEEFAAENRVHVTTVRRWIALKQVKAYKLPGGSLRIPRSEYQRIREPVGAGA